MRVETQIILFILILNISTILVTSLGDLGVIAGVSFNKPSNATTGNYTQYEQQFNASDTMKTWEQPVGTLTLLGDLWGGLQFFFKMIAFVFVGFPYMLWTLGDAFIMEGTVEMLVWQAITGALTAIFGIYMSFYIIQLITGRQMNE